MWVCSCSYFSHGPHPVNSFSVSGHWLLASSSVCNRGLGMSAQQVLCAVGRAEHGPVSIQAACNGIACVRHIFSSPAVRGSSACLAAFKAVLLPVLELIPKASGRPTLGLVQLELVLLLQAALPDLPAVFPSHEGAVHAAPPSGATADESLTWYALQQSLLCCLQVCPFRFSVDDLV